MVKLMVTLAIGILLAMKSVEAASPASNEPRKTHRPGSDAASSTAFSTEVREKPDPGFAAEYPRRSSGRPATWGVTFHESQYLHRTGQSKHM